MRYPTIILPLTLLASLFLFLTTPIPAVEHELLKEQDIHQVMQKIFQQHVDKKGMTGAILHNAFKVYINQFDPDRIYLLEEEVRPYLQLDNARMTVLLNAYENRDLSSFEQLNTLIQHSIKRSRQYRHDLINNPPSHATLTALTPSSAATPPFVKTTSELQQRILANLNKFIQSNEKLSGTSLDAKSLAQSIKAYDKHMSHKENQYLAVDEAGHPLPPEQSENLFALHVLKAIANSLDAHTKVLNPSEAYEMRIRLEKRYQGIGVQLDQQDGKIFVTKLLENGPAIKSGKVQVGDQIMAVDGKTVEDESLDTILNWLREGTGSVILLIKRNPFTDQLVTITLSRGSIPVEEGRVEVSSENFGRGIIGKIALHSFYQGEGQVSSENDIRKAIEQLKKEGYLLGLIIDMRDNTGGFLGQAVKVAGLFITSGVIVISKYSTGEERVYRDVDNKDIYEGPLVILTSKGTASAAEIMAQALQDYGVALVVGDARTYGKGTIQSQTVTGNTSGAGSSFTVTVGEYYTVSGRTPQLTGVKADIVVPGPFEHAHIGEKYLAHTIASEDKIASTYNDPLKDIPQQNKQWFLRYYTPSLQKKITTWSDLLPTLKTNSAQRIAQNKDYQTMLQEGSAASFTDDDPQIEEAVNIVKDMILLRKGMKPEG